VAESPGGGSEVSHLELLQVSLWFGLILVAAVGFGRLVTGALARALKIKQPSQESLIEAGVALAVGMAAISYGSLVLGLVGYFEKTGILIMLLVMLALSLPQMLKLLKGIKIGKVTPMAAGLLLLAAAILGTVYLSAMQPPHTSDELNYHFPDAVRIVKAGRVDLAFDGHYFYGNIPKQMEVLYAAMISLSGYPLAHLAHFAYLVAYLLIVMGVLSRVYSVEAGAWGVLLTLMYDDLTWNMTSGFVDGAAFVMEVSALLLTLLYLTKRQNKGFVYMAGLCLGVGMAVKYSVAVTGALIVVLLLPEWQAVWQLAAVCGVMGGFWYIRNLLWFGNPFYPLYLGHYGVAEEQYRELVAAIQQFGPKTLTNLIERVKYFREIPRIPVLAALVATPLSWLVGKNRKFVRILSLYVLGYLLYWFYLGTHQIRFLAPSVMTALLVAAIVLSRVKMIWLLMAAAAVTIYMLLTPYFDQTVWSYFWSTKFHLTERQYALGNLTQDEFMTRWYGCYYESIRYLEEKGGEGAVVDNWSSGIEFNVPFYARNWWYVRTTEEDPGKLQAMRAKYMLVNGRAKKQYLERPEAYFRDTKAKLLEYEEWLTQHSKLTKSYGECEIYTIED